MNVQQSLWVFYDSIAKIQSNRLTRDEAQSTILKIRPQTIDRYFIWTQGWENWQPLRSYLESDQKVFVSTFTVSHSNEETAKAVAKEIFEQTITYAHTKTSFRHHDNVNEPPASDQDTKSVTNTAYNRIYSKINLNDEPSINFNRSGDPNNDYTTQFEIEHIDLKNIKKPSFDFSKITKRMDQREPRLELKIEVLLISPRGKNISLTGALLEDCMPFDFYEVVFDVVVISHITGKGARVKLQGRSIVAGGNYTQRLQFINPTADQKKDLQNLLKDYVDATKALKSAG